MAVISSVPAVLDYLVQAWQAALPDVQVTDGQPLDMNDDIVCVGFTGTPGETSVHAERERDGLSNDRDYERYTITSMVSAWRGRELDAKVVRDATYTMVDTMAGVLADDQTLGGLVLRAMISAGDLAQWQTDDGATDVLQVTVSIVGPTRE